MIQWANKNEKIIVIILGFTALIIALATLLVNFGAWRMPVSPSNSSNNQSAENSNTDRVENKIPGPLPTPEKTFEKETTVAPTISPTIDKTNPIPTPTPTPIPTPPPSKLAGNWKFQFNISKFKNNRGFIVEKAETVISSINLDENGGNITGAQLGHTGGTSSSACRKAGISGRLNGDQVTFVITYNCCEGSQVRFTGIVDQQYRNLTGSLEPVGIPRGSNCKMPYAEVSGVKQE